MDNLRFKQLDAMAEISRHVLEPLELRTQGGEFGHELAHAKTNNQKHYKSSNWFPRPSTSSRLMNVLALQGLPMLRAENQAANLLLPEILFRIEVRPSVHFACLWEEVTKDAL
mmetsp:Transcript_56999/g.90349  ORF Transcript_56999/g.90349 Transcript_56999/m.90349 type:complete len:113 (-) Transcript_56999:410-748(-)